MSLIAHSNVTWTFRFLPGAAWASYVLILGFPSFLHCSPRCKVGMEVEGVGMQVGGGRVGTEVEGGETDEEALPVDGASGGDLGCCWGCWLWLIAVGSSLAFGMFDFGFIS